MIGGNQLCFAGYKVLVAYNKKGTVIGLEKELSTIEKLNYYLWEKKSDYSMRLSKENDKVNHFSYHSHIESCYRGFFFLPYRKSNSLR